MNSTRSNNVLLKKLLKLLMFILQDVFENENIEKYTLEEDFCSSQHSKIVNSDDSGEFHSDDNVYAANGCCYKDNTPVHSSVLPVAWCPSYTASS